LTVRSWNPSSVHNGGDTITPKPKRAARGAH
jgi:hypothetical protein